MAAASPVPLLFVYGSLRIGSANPHAAFLHSGCRRVGSGKMPGRLFRNGSLHGAVYEEKSESHVVGDVLELPPERAEDILVSLDRYEGIGSGLPKPSPFRRGRVAVVLENGTRVDCWAWLYNLPLSGCSYIRHGDALKP
jgi:gamma-glutamylcyclotransferase (GGCT)/AIG2-like uncharacterized protein YtfP